MRNTIALTLLTLCLVSSCSKKDETQEMDAAADPLDPMAEPEMPILKPKPTEDPKIVIGVAICDAFLDRYRACYKQLPPGIKAQMKKGFEDTEQALLRAKDVDDAEATLTEACQQLDQSISTSMRAQGCVWE